MCAPLIFSFPGNESFGERLALSVDAECGEFVLRSFPDAESYVKVESDPTDRDVVVVATLVHPNDKMLPLLFLMDALRDLGARRIGLVAPYLAYMRQDKRFNDGEALTSRSFATVLSRAADWLLTVDPHLHRWTDLRQVYSMPAVAVHVASVVGAWIGTNVDTPLIVGPDSESRQWVETIAAAAHAPSIVLTKTRQGDSDVVESQPDLGELAARTPVLVDDIISTGQTMLVAIRHLKEHGARTPVCVGIHAVFADGARNALEEAGVARVVTTNTIPHPSNAIDILPALSTVLGAQLGNAGKP